MSNLRSTIRPPIRRACITGGAGFVGSTIADYLYERGTELVLVDDFRAGRREFIQRLVDRPGATLMEGDVLDQDLLERAFAGCDWVFHMQANADVRHGLEHPSVDLEQNTLATAGVLEAMRRTGVRNIVFASTGSIYGEPNVFPTPEDAPFPHQTSLYGASKLACEGLISAYAAGYDLTAVIGRFVSVLGERYTHGHVYDFFCSLKHDPSTLHVLGDGKQEKSYLYVRDLVSALFAAVARHSGDSGAHIYNLGTDETMLVNDSIGLITEHMGVSPRITYAGGKRGWIGDSPRIFLDTAKIRSLGWAPQVTIRESIIKTLTWFDQNEYAWHDRVMAMAAG
jgi:UDP-glucose 4-epimerase